MLVRRSHLFAALAASLTLFGCLGDDPLPDGHPGLGNIPPPGQGAKPAIVDVQYPTTAVPTGSLIDISWAVQNTDNLMRTRAEWSTTQGVHDMVTGDAVESGGRWGTQLIAPATPTVIYFIITANDANGQIGSPEFSITVGSGGMPSIEVLSYPMAVNPNDPIEINWAFRGATDISQNHVLWGTAAGMQNQAVGPGISTGPDTYRQTFNAPANPGTIYFIVRGATPMGMYATPELTIEVRPTAGPSITVDNFSASVAPNDPIKVDWTLISFSTPTENKVLWGTAPGNYPNQTPVGAVTSGSSFSQTFNAPANPGPVYLVVEALENGTPVRSPEVRVNVAGGPAPAVTIDNAPTMVNVGAPITIDWSLANITSPMSNRVRWGTTAGTYPNQTADGTARGPDRFTTTFNAPATPGPLFFVVEAIENGTPTRSPEQQITVVAGQAPGVTVDSAPTTADVTTPITIRWSLANIAAPTNNVIQLGTATGVYGTSTPQGTLTATPNQYEVTFNAPAAPGQLFFVAEATDPTGTYRSPEGTITIAAPPTVTIDSAPTAVGPGAPATVTWTVANAPNLVSTQCRWGTMAGNYPNSANGTTTGAAGQYSTTITAPNTAGTIYYVCEVTDATGTYATPERTITVNAAPSVSLGASPAFVLVGATIRVEWTLNNMGTPTANQLRWGTTAGAYPNTESGLNPLGNNSYSVTFTAPNAPGTVYFIAEATDATGTYQSMEGSVIINAQPAISVDTYPMNVGVGDPITVIWTLTNMPNPTSNALLWGSDPSNVTNAVGGTMPLPNDQFTATFPAPATPTTIYIRCAANDVTGTVATTPVAITVNAGAQVLNPGDTIGPIATPQGEETPYVINTEPGREYIVVLIPDVDGGDLDLYTKLGGGPISRTEFDCRPFYSGTRAEVCRATGAANIPLQVLVHGFAAGSYVISVFVRYPGQPVPDAVAFDTPVAPPNATITNDGDGWYSVLDFDVPNASNLDHIGIDWSSELCPTCDNGRPIFAAADGEVVSVQDGGTGWLGIVAIRHSAPAGASFAMSAGASEVVTFYGLMDARYSTPMATDTWLRVGDVVRRGQPVGVMGTGIMGSTDPFLHYEIRTNVNISYPGPAFDASTMGYVDPTTFTAAN